MHSNRYQATMTLHYNRSPKKDYSIVKLVCWQQWYNLEEILNSDTSATSAVFDDRVKNQLPQDHILHLACQYQAPTRIIELLSQRYPDSSSSSEKNGRYPVHIACAKGLKPGVIEFLLKAHPAAASIQDDYGKTPLIYACESYSRNFVTNPANAHQSPDKSLVQVINSLLNHVPQAANVEDDSGMNAIEYAIDSDAPIAVIKMMQEASRASWRSIKQLHRGSSHEELRNSLRQSLTSSFVLLGSSANPLNLSEDTASEFGETKSNDDDRFMVRRSFNADSLEKKVQVARTA